jgi:hypothetical protein
MGGAHQGERRERGMIAIAAGRAGYSRGAGWEMVCRPSGAIIGGGWRSFRRKRRHGRKRRRDRTHRSHQRLDENAQFVGAMSAPGRS